MFPLGLAPKVSMGMISWAHRSMSIGPKGLRDAYQPDEPKSVLGSPGVSCRTCHRKS